MNINTTLEFIQQAHAGQFDKAGKPYYLHCVSVMNRLPVDASENAKHIALLHDVIEDTAIGPIDLLNMGYSEEIVSGVQLLSRDRSNGLTYLKWIQTIADSGNIDAIMVKIADNEDNSDPERTFYLKPEENMTNRYMKSLAILRPVLAELRAKRMTGLYNSLSPDQQETLRNYTGPDTFGVIQ
jgi:(p)ppGpp synthase/HD superfamily hydrolase